MHHRAIRIVNIAILLVIVFAGFGMAVRELWNHLIPEIFGLKPISYWQAVGLMGLSWILFGGLRGFGIGGPRMGGMRHLTPEQREVIRTALERKRGGCQPTEA